MPLLFMRPGLRSQDSHALHLQAKNRTKNTWSRALNSMHVFRDHNDSGHADRRSRSTRACLRLVSQVCEVRGTAVPVLSQQSKPFQGPPAGQSYKELSKMTWIQTRTGLAVDLLDPKPEQFSLLDIASSLSRLCRYTGHSRDHTSVAEHCCRVSDIILRRLVVTRSLAVAVEAAWAGHTHDAPEQVTGDVSRPMKLAMRDVAHSQGRDESDFDVVSHRVELACRMKVDPYGRAHVWEATVKLVDLEDLVSEKSVQLGPPPRPWTDTQKPHGFHIECWDAPRARREWLMRAIRLAPTQELRNEALDALGKIAKEP